MPIWICAAFLSSAVLAEQAPARSFADLTLKEGQRVTIVDAKGNTTRGRVVSLAGNQLEVLGTQEPRRSMLRKIFGFPHVALAGETYVLSSDVVIRIKRVDSAWNGTLMGIGIGALLGVSGCTGESRDETCPIPVLAIGAVGGVIGNYIDGLIEKTVYISPKATTVAFMPLLGAGRVGMAATFRF